MSILRLDLSVEVLGFILSRLHDSNNFIKLAILVFKHCFLVLEHLAIVEVTSLIVLAVLSFVVLGCVSCGGQASLIVFKTPVLLSELASDEVLDVVDEGDATSNLFLVDTGILVWLVLIVVHQLVEVAQVSLKGGPSGFHQVLLTGDGLTGAGIRDLVHLIA